MLVMAGILPCKIFHSLTGSCRAVRVARTLCVPEIQGKTKENRKNKEKIKGKPAVPIVELHCWFIFFGQDLERKIIGTFFQVYFIWREYI